MSLNERWRRVAESQHFRPHDLSFDNPWSAVLGRQIVAGYLKQLGQDRPVKPLERLAANTYGASIADAMIAKMLTPENLTAILSKGEISSAAGTSMVRLTEIDTSNVLETLMRISPMKPTEFMIRLGKTEGEGGISLHFEGDGWSFPASICRPPPFRCLRKTL